MSKKKTSRGKRPGVAARKPRRKVAIAVAVVASVIAAWTMLAYSNALDSAFSQKGSKKRTVSTESLNSNSPTKEYVYAGGRLVATEESAQSCDTSNPTSDTDLDGIPNGVEPGEGIWS